MNYDTIIDKKINQNSLQADLQQHSWSISSILSSVNEPLILLDAKLVIAFINGAANAVIKKISGIFFEPGESILNLLEGEQQINLKKHLDQALSGKYVQQQVKILNNNEWIWLECLFKPLNSGHNSNGISVVLKDISPIKETDENERNKKEEKHFHGKALFESFMENTPLSAWITDNKGIIHYLNPAFRKLYNLPLDDLSRTMDEIFPKDLSDEYKENNLLALKSGHMIEVVERTLKPDGTMAIYRVFKFPMAIGSDTMIGGWSIEITEEAKLQEQLTNSIERYSFVNEATSDAIYDWDPTDNILYRGKGFAILFGFHDPYVPLDFRFIRIHPVDVERVKKTYLSALEDATLKRWKLKYRLKDAKGIYKNVVDKAFIIRENGKVVRVIGAIQDITEYNQLQEKLVL